jgi:hypothetical protein
VVGGFERHASVTFWSLGYRTGIQSLARGWVWAIGDSSSRTIFLLVIVRGCGF